MQSLGSAQILLVDDDPEVVRLYELLLGELGHKVLSCKSAPEALERISTQPLDVLITDIRMPEMSGLELVREALVLEPDLQCIIISAINDQQSIIEAIKLGALSYLRKPVDFNELALTVRQGLQRVQLIREARQSRRQLEHETTKNRLILEAAGDGIIGLDGQCLVTFINASAEAMLGLEGRHLLGSPIHELLHFTPEAVGHYPHSHPPFNCLQGLERRIEGEGLLRAPSMGTPLPVHFVATPMEEQGHLLGRVVVFRDISRVRQADTALRRAKQAAEAASHTQSRFLANMSHELRSPLDAILSHSQALKLDLQEGEAERWEHLQIIERSGRTLLTLIDELLEMARIDADAPHVQTQRTYLPQLLGEIREELASRLADQGASLEYYESKYLPKWVLVDPERLLHLMAHLADSLQRLSDSPLFTLTLSWHAEALKIEFTESLAEGQTEPFLPSLGSAQSETLTLLICRRLAQAMQGSVKLVYDELSRLRLHSIIPLRRAPLDDLGGEAADADEESLAWDDIPIYRLLLAAPPGTERDQLHAMLAYEGLDVVTADDSVAVLHLCAMGDIDLLLLDAELGPGSPQHLLDHLRSDLGNTTPVLLLTERDTHPSLPKGAQELLAKPLAHPALLAALTRHLTRRQMLPDDDLPDLNCPPPTPAVSDQIRRLIQQGDVMELRAYLAEQQRHHPDSSLHATLLRLAKRFDFRSILKLLDQYGG